MTIPTCFDTPKVSETETYALRALEAGEADAYQQRLALQVILRKFCRVYDQPFVPGASDQTSFLAGRAFPGQLVMKHLKLDIELLKEKSDENQ